MGYLKLGSPEWSFCGLSAEKEPGSDFQRRGKRTESDVEKSECGFLLMPIGGGDPSLSPPLLGLSLFTPLSKVGPP